MADQEDYKLPNLNDREVLELIYYTSQRNQKMLDVLMGELAGFKAAQSEDETSKEIIKEWMESVEGGLESIYKAAQGR